MTISFNITDIAIITVKSDYYCCIIHNISKSEAIRLFKNSVLENLGYIYRKYYPKFFLFYFAISKMTDSEYNMDFYKSVNISIRKAMRKQEMLKFVSDYLKTKTNM